MTVPLPDPDAPVRTVIQDTPETADQAQPPATAMSTLAFPPAAAMFCVAGVSDASHDAPAWVITNGCPATVMVADRELVSGFAATTYPTDPFPLPVVGVEKVIHATGLCAVHAHVPPAVTAIVPGVCDAMTETVVGEML